MGVLQIGTSSSRFSSRMKTQKSSIIDGLSCQWGSYQFIRIIPSFQTENPTDACLLRRLHICYVPDLIRSDTWYNIFIHTWVILHVRLVCHSWFTPYVVTRYLSQLLKATGGGPFWSFWYLSPDGYKSCKHPVSETEHRISDKFEIQVFNPDILIVHLGDLSNQFI